MSDAQQHDGSHEGPHEGPIRTPKQLIVTVIAAFVVPVILIILLTHFVSSEGKAGAGSEGFSAEATAKRLQPVGSVEIRAGGANAVLRTGEQVFTGQCAACHATGAAGAPKVGDAAAWGPRVKNGYEALLTSALKGKGAMAPQGGGEFSDLEIGRAVVFMANQGGAQFAEPKAPAAAASAASAPK